MFCHDQHGGRVASGGDAFALLTGAPLAQYTSAARTLLKGDIFQETF